MTDPDMVLDEAGRSGSAVAPSATQAVALRDWLVLLLLTAAMMFSFVDRFTFALLLEPIKQTLKVSDAQLGMVNGVAFGLFYTTMGLPLGRLADRWSRKGTIMVSMSIWTTATAVCGLAMNLGQLFVGRIGVGAGEAGLSPASYGVIYDRFPRKLLALAISISQIGGNIGIGVAFVYAGAAYQWFQDGAASGWPIVGHFHAWQLTFLAVALPGLPLLGLLSLMREPKKRLEFGAAAAAAKLTFGQIKGFALTFLAFSGGVLASNALAAWMPAVLAREYHWSPKVVGSTYGFVVMFAGAAGMLTGGWISDLRMRTVNRGDHLPISIFSAVTVLPLMLGVGFCSNSTQLLVLAAMMHFLLSLPYGVMPAYIQLKAPAASRGQISALYVLTINAVAQGAGPVLIGYVSSLRPHEPTALRFAVVLVSSLFLAATAVSLFLIARRERLSGAA